MPGESGGAWRESIFRPGGFLKEVTNFYRDNQMESLCLLGDILRVESPFFGAPHACWETLKAPPDKDFWPLAENFGWQHSTPGTASQ
jgi:hypothetical protein